MVGYEVDADPGRIDMEVVWSYLHKDAYWGRGPAGPMLRTRSAVRGGLSGPTATMVHRSGSRERCLTVSRSPISLTFSS